MTLTENVHCVFAARLPPVSVTVDAVPGGLFGAAAIVPAPHVPVTTLLANLIFVGRVSANATFVSPIAFAFVTVKLNVLGCPTTIVDGVNDF